MLLKILKKTIQKYSMILPGEKIVVAFSGGADSTALLVSLKELSDELGVEIFACHLNHRIRGTEAYNDARFCRAFAEQYSIPFYYKEMAINIF
jgi:tRNA(Ile)-lysidine synthase